MNFRKMLINNARKAMLDNIEALDKKTLQKELKKSLQEQFRLNNIIKNIDKMFEYYFLGNLKYDQDTVNTIYIKYVKLKELKEVTKYDEILCEKK